MNEPHANPATQFTNRLLDEGVMLVVKAAQAEGIGISSKTALRWCIAGLRGIRLESLKIGGQRMTSRQALRRFIASTQVPPPTAPPVRAQLDSDATEKTLAAYGLGRSNLANPANRATRRDGEATP